MRKFRIVLRDNTRPLTYCFVEADRFFVDPIGIMFTKDTDEKAKRGDGYVAWFTHVDVQSVEEIKAVPSKDPGGGV